MNHHPIFNQFQRVQCIGTGQHVFDFLGIATDVAYKKDWENHALKINSKYKANYPPLNEHYFDWIALLTCVSNATGTFRMAELGAGWAPWLVRGLFASRQISSIEQVELLAVEADTTHFNWIKKHFLDNYLDPDDYYLFNGAVADTSSMLKFPKISNPDEDYGASLKSVTPNSEFIKVQGYTLENLFCSFTGVLDFLHMDVQGAEYDVLPTAMELLKTSVKAVMIGTHFSSEKHEELKDLFFHNGWISIMIYPRNEEVDTEYGRVQFVDGFQFWKNPDL